MSKLIILDVESYLYKASHSCKDLREIEKFVYQEVLDLRKGIDYIDNTVKRLKNLLKAQDVVMVIGDSDKNFRKDIFPKYKGNRTQPKPIMYDMLMDYIINKYEIVTLPTLEADDVARIIFEDKENFPYNEKVIVSIDKDFYTIPNVNFLRDLNDNKVVEFINAETADYNLKLQTIMGDSVDGYNGIPNWGKAKAQEFLREKERTWADVLELYKVNGLDSSDYITNKYCAKLVGIKDYDIQKGEVILNAND